MLRHVGTFLCETIFRDPWPLRTQSFTYFNQVLNFRIFKLEFHSSIKLKYCKILNLAHLQAYDSQYCALSCCAFFLCHARKTFLRWKARLLTRWWALHTILLGLFSFAVFRSHQTKELWITANLPPQVTKEVRNVDLARHFLNSKTTVCTSSAILYPLQVFVGLYLQGHNTPLPPCKMELPIRRHITAVAVVPQPWVTLKQSGIYRQKSRLNSSRQRQSDVNRAKTGERRVFTQLLFQSRRGKDRGSLNTPWWNLQSPVSVHAVNVEKDKTVRRDM